MVGNLHQGRAWHTASVLNNGQVLVTGGMDDGFFVINSSELYDPSTGSWTTVNSMNIGRFCHTASVLTNGDVLVIGGESSSYITSNTLGRCGFQPSLCNRSAFEFD